MRLAITLPTWGSGWRLAAQAGSVLLMSLSGLLMSGCVTVPDLPSHQNAAQVVTTVSGRFSISFERDGASQREQGAFEWKINHAKPPSAVSAPASALSQTNPARTPSRSNASFFSTSSRTNTVVAEPVVPNLALRRQAASQPAMQLSLLSPLGNTLALLAYNPEAALAQRASIQTPQQRFVAADLDSLMSNTLGWRLPLLDLLPWLGQKTPSAAPQDWLINVNSRYDSDFPRLIVAQNKSQALNVRLVLDDQATTLSQ